MACISQLISHMLFWKYQDDWSLRRLIVLELAGNLTLKPTEVDLFELKLWQSEGKRGELNNLKSKYFCLNRTSLGRSGVFPSAPSAFETLLLKEVAAVL